MQNYNRVIPRDFFNESKLLKCLGNLTIKNGELGTGIEIDENGESFDIQLSDDGILFVSNYSFELNGVDLSFGTRYNSKSNYPLVLSYCYEEVDVFDENGNYTSEFLQTISDIKTL